MKLITKITEKNDKILLTGSILPINDIEFDLDNLTEDNTKPVYLLKNHTYDELGEIIDTTEDKIINVNILKTHEFIMRKENIYRWFKIDLDMMNLEELGIIIDKLNTPIDELKPELKVIQDKFKADRKAEGLKDYAINRAWLEAGKIA